MKATIASGASLSGAVKLAGAGISGLNMPATWTTANITFAASEDDDAGTFNAVYDQYGAEYTVTAAASRYIVVDPAMFVGMFAVKIRSGTSASPVNQSGDRSIVVATFTGE